ncbi:MAG: single-stranded DNA-binding protein [Dehalococcoidales bacterium]|nr:single-stranded DNA-binding protein [Dehalococcoidales bacterium]
MLTLNKVMIIGNVGTEPEMRFTPNGNPVTSFRVATNRRYTTPEGERREEAEWFTVVAWNRLAENCNQFLTKGRLVYAEGRLHAHTWEGQDGQKYFRNEIVANRVSFLDRQPVAPLPGEGAEEIGAGETGAGETGAGEVGTGDPEAGEDVPFSDEG